MQKQPCVPMVGTDIEAFVFNTTTGNFIPCVGLLPGTKEEPFPLKGYPTGYAVQEDNVMAEFNIPPAKNSRDFYRSISAAIQEVTRMLPKEHVLVFDSSVQFKPTDLLSPQSRMIGCDPDYDAYTGGEERTKKPRLDLWRSAGGHIHLGGDFRCPDFVAALFAELFIGVTQGLSSAFSKCKRAQWYGRPGIYRPKPYGIEYRTPNNQWANVGKSTSTIQYIGDAALKCARWLTQTEALRIQQAFRLINWTEVAAYMSGDSSEIKTKNDLSVARNKIIKQARDAGVML